MKGAWSAVAALDERVKKITALVRGAGDPSPARGRELTTLFMQPVRVEVTNPPNLQERLATYYHGDRDELVLKNLGAYVKGLNNQGAAAFSQSVLARTADGFSIASAFSDIASDVEYPFGAFDFQWNYEIGTRQSRYSRDAVSSDALMGLGDRGSLLEFRTPLRIGRGETIQFRVKPLYIDFRRLIQTTGALTLDSFFVVFVGLGHRSHA